LAPKAFAVLDYLVRNAGRLVSQEELLEALWPETFVQPEVLRKYILEIRRVLDDPAKAPRFVETLSKRGYRFMAPVHEAPSATEPGPAPPGLVGRESSLADLDSGWRLALGGQRQVVFVTGEPGIGKSSLVDAFHAHAALAGTRIARGQCVEGFGGKESYYPVLEALGLSLRGAGGDGLRETLASHAPTWLVQFPALVSADEREVLRREILGATRERMLREICEALEVFTAGQPLILILEDLHLADESTLDLVSALARRRLPARLMLVATYRPADAILSRSPLKALKQDLQMHRLCHEIGLAPLTQGEVGAYLRAEFPESRLDADLSALIHHSSDGNPLFMVALVERLQQRGWIARGGRGWQLTVQPEQMDPGVPETLQQMIEVQLDLVSTSEQRLLRAASVPGLRFAAWALAAMTGSAEGATEQQCEDLAAHQQFIRRAGTQELPDGSVSAQYEFKHSLYREVLYARLPPTARRQYHLRLAERAESLGAARDPALAGEMAAHFEAGRDFARATRYLLAAAALAAQRYAHGDAIQTLGRALDLVPHLAAEEGRVREIEILERLSDALYAQGEMARSAEVEYKVVELAAQAGQPVARINAWTRLARVLAFQDPARCVEVCELAVEEARFHGDALLVARAEMLRACWRIVSDGWNARDAAECAAALDRIHTLSDGLPEYHEILYAHVQCVAGDYEGGYRMAAAGVPKSLENNNLTVFLSAHSSMAFALLHLGRWGELLRVLSAAILVVEKNGNAPWAGIFRATLGWLSCQAGDLEGARGIAQDLLRSHTEEPAGQVRTMAMVIAGYAALAAGEHGAALESLRRVCERQAQPRFFLDWYWRIVGWIGLAPALAGSGDVVRAVEEADRALASALATADGSLQALAWVAKAQLAGDEDLGWEYLEKARGVLSGRDLPYAAWKVCAMRAGMRGLAEDRACAAAAVSRLADSFETGEPLRQSLRAAAGK
jgi:hypothetical protein